MMLLRHLVSILLLPFVMVVLVPRWITGGSATFSNMSAPLAAQIGGGILFAAGFALFALCVALFAIKGKGTLAPWDPTKRLVATGPYRYMRNPMITGVATMLAGQAIFHWSRPLAWWFLIFLTFNHVYFMVIEEPGLERRFGADYRRYRSEVPRWIPRMTAWKDA